MKCLVSIRRGLRVAVLMRDAMLSADTGLHMCGTFATLLNVDGLLDDRVRVRSRYVLNRYAACVEGRRSDGETEFVGREGCLLALATEEREKEESVREGVRHDESRNHSYARARTHTHTHTRAHTHL
jgi:hypothetical protein